MKKELITIVLVLTVLVCSGCVQTKIELAFKDDSKYDAKVTVTTDEDYYGSTFDVYLWQLNYAFPEILGKYNHTAFKSETNYSNYVNHVFSATNIDVKTQSKNFKFEKKSDGTYLFESTIPALLKQDEIEDSNKDAVAVVLIVKMPRPVDIANTPFVDNNIVTWSITNQMLAKGVTLKVLTK